MTEKSNRKIVGYVGAIIIGVGFIMMAAANTLRSELASTIQAALGAVFIVVAIKKIVFARKKDD